jgi:hypothetical protein
MITLVVLYVLVILLIVIYYVINMRDDGFEEGLRKLADKYYLIETIFNNLKKDGDCAISELQIENSVLTLEYWYNSDEPEEKRLDKVNKIIKENCDFYGPMLGIDIRDVKITIKKLDFINETI